MPQNMLESFCPKLNTNTRMANSAELPQNMHVLQLSPNSKKKKGMHNQHAITQNVKQLFQRTSFSSIKLLHYMI